MTLSVTVADSSEKLWNKLKKQGSSYIQRRRRRPCQFPFACQMFQMSESITCPLGDWFVFEEWKRFGPFCCGFFAHFAAVVEGLRRWMAFASFSFVRPFPSTDCDESLAASKWNSLEAFIGSPYSFAVEFSGLNALPSSLWPKKFLAWKFHCEF